MQKMDHFIRGMVIFLLNCMFGTLDLVSGTTVCN